MLKKTNNKQTNKKTRSRTRDPQACRTGREEGGGGRILGGRDGETETRAGRRRGEGGFCPHVGLGQRDTQGAVAGQRAAAEEGAVRGWKEGPPH